MDTSFIITFIGDDRPGLVEELSAVITDQGGNWRESRLQQLAGKFAGLVSVSLPSDRGEDLRAALKALAPRGLSVKVTALESLSGDEHPGRTIRLTIIGPDRPGIVREISAALAQQHINVVDMRSDVSSAPMSAEAMFSASVEAQISERSDLDELNEKLEEIANQMSVDVQLDVD
ncbi:MAG: ACT domain-containing protein [Gammaproteobacteria bacterium]|nr:ACT domain-containing protein [Gammaproteobacteria bacterium]